MLELAAIDLLAGGVPLNRAALEETLQAGDEASRAGDWVTAGTTNLYFHSALVAVHSSARVSEFFRRLMTEMRLGFLALADPQAFHAPYLVRNREIYDSLVAGNFDGARAALEAYLDDAMRQVSAAVIHYGR
jgi:DNA-binding GntR family transcriptional regulator